MREFHSDSPIAFFSKLFDTSDYPARWYCGTWTLETGWLHVVSDAAIFGAYFSIPLAIVFFMRRRRDFPYWGLLGLFAAFILACGIGHLIEACIFWWPAYRLSGLVKAITAIISWTTVFFGLRVIPKLLSLPGMARLNEELTEQRNLLDTIINDCTLPIFWKNTDCQIIGCNQAFVRLVGCDTVDEVLEQDADSQMGIEAESVERYLGDDRHVISSGEPLYDYEEEVGFESGTRTLRTSKVPRFDADGNVCGLIGFCSDITEAKQSAAAITEAERLFRVTFDQAAVGIAHCDPEGRWLLANDVMSRITGYSRQELLETNFQSITHPDDLEADNGHLREFLEGKATERRWEKRYVRKDGSDVNVRVTVSAVSLDNHLERFIVVVQDISDEVDTRQKIAESQEEIVKLSLVADNIQHSVAITNSEGRIEWVNDEFVGMTGYKLEEVVGKKPGSFLQGPLTDQETVDRIRTAVAERTPIAEEIVNYHADGEAYWIRLEISPVFDEKGELTQFISTQSDITARKRQQGALEKASEAAQAANLAKSEFLANMSHEIRTPLNGILGFTELLIEGDENLEERRDQLRTIRASGRHLLELINSVLDLSKIEAGQLTVEVLNCSPHAILAEVVSILRVRASEKGITLDYEWNGLVPASIQTDPHRFKQLLMNLIGNAIKFTDRGEVRVVAALDNSQTTPSLRVDIRDTGAGIKADRLDSIFEPFIQADNSVTRQYGGTGLGLSISRKVAESLGGSLTCESIVGLGSCFTAMIATGSLENVELHETAPQITDSDVTGSELDAVSLEGLRVLVADDGSTNRKLIRVILARAGAEVKTAENGQLAVQMVDEEDFDVILMDMQMPVMDGYTATRRLRENGYTQPIIALTANAMKGDRQKCMQAGCSGYLSKPIDLGELTRTLASTQNSPLDSAEATENEVPGVGSETLRASPQASEGPRSKSLSVPLDADSRVSYRCTLPVEDPEIRAIVQEFIDKLAGQIELIEEAVDNDDLAEVARLAHWLKGAGGTVGFNCFTDPAKQLEQQSKQNEDGISDSVRQIRSMADAIQI